MSERNPDNVDVSRACWRCLHFGEIVAGAHASCKRGAAPLQASPATGCVYWTAGPGDANPPGWIPREFRFSEQVMIWGNGPSAPPPPPPAWETGRPGVPADAAKWNRDREREAWHATVPLMARARGHDEPAA